MKYKLFHIIVIGLVFGTGYLFIKNSIFNSSQVLFDLEQEIGIVFPGSHDFEIQKNLLREGGGNSYRSIEATSGGKLLKLEITTGLSAEDSGQKIGERLNIIRSLFSNIPSPYPGAVTKEIDVSDDSQPKTLTFMAGKTERTLYIFSSNSRHTYGAMTSEMVSFRGGLVFIYDEAAKRLFRIDLFIPKAEFNEKDLVDFFQDISLSSKGDTGKNTDKNDRLLKTTDGDTKNSIAKSVNASTLVKPRYNLILIAFEPLGADHVSAYGYKKKTTPNLDEFAKESVLFENAISPSSWTLPVFMSWFTSMYPSQHKVTNKYSTYNEKEKVLANLADLSPDAITLTNVLKEQGYSSAAFTGGSSLAGSFGFSAGFDHYFDDAKFGGFDLTMPKALEWLKVNRGEKFFLFVQGFDVHGKYPLDQKYLNRFLEKPYAVDLKTTEEEYWKLRNKNLKEGHLSISDDYKSFLQAAYDAKIYAADHRFGGFINELRRQDLLDNSIIIVSSGSGNEYLQHGGIDHGFSLYDELLQVPLLIRIPGYGGKRVEELVRTLDMMPTILDTLGIKAGNKVQAQMRGVSLLPLLSGETLNLNAISETDYLNRAFKRSIKTHDGWKFIVSLDSENRELFNLDEDPDEMNNVISIKPRLAYELEQKLFMELKR